MEQRQLEERALLIGLGNSSRQDDAAGYIIASEFCERLGIELCGDVNDLPDMSGPIQAMWLQQLVPEVSEAIAAYDMVIFVDAHTGANASELATEPMSPTYRSSLVSHHMKPETLLAMARDLYGHAPRGIQVSVRGYEFDFGTELSQRTRKLASRALERILQLVSADSAG